MVVLVLAYVANQGLWRNRGGERVVVGGATDRRKRAMSTVGLLAGQSGQYTQGTMVFIIGVQLDLWQIPQI
jgi:hypothetical protein